MTPYRLFYHLLKARVDASSFVPNFPNAADWTTTHSEVPYIHFQEGGVGDKYEKSFIITRGRREDGWEALSGADYWMKLFMFAEILPAEYDTVPCTWYKFVTGVLHDPHGAADEPDYGYLSGRWYKSPQVEWPAFPIDYDWSYAGYTREIPPADLPCTERLCIPAWDAVVDNFIALPWSDEGLKNGVVIARYSHGGVTSDGEGFTIDINVQDVVAHYMNPMTNSLSRYSGPAAGGYPLVLTGLGFDNDDDEIEEGGHERFGGWDDRVDYIYIQKPDGTAVATLQRTLGHFTVDSNTQITIPTMPALPVGVYMFYLRKDEAGYNIYGYAGDWRTSSTGRMSAGARLYFIVGEILPGPPVVLTKWRWKKGDNYVFRYYAPIDVRATVVFYDGMILGVSAFTRGVNDDTGLPLLPDLEVTLDNTSQEFSKLLAEYWVKNQPVEVYYAWQDQPEVMKEIVFRGVVADYELPHSQWKVRLRSVLEKYMTVSIPQYRCTLEEYPNIHPNHINREMPEVLGFASYTEGSTPGAVEAIYVDTTTFEYLGARGSLHAVTEVYADGILVNAANYAIVYKDGGRTYIDFDSDRGDSKITFNAEGYTYVDWDDPTSGVGGYVMNPAYVILFALAFFIEVPETEVDIESFDDLADRYDALGYGQAGYLIQQDAKDSSSVLQELLWTYGAKLWPTADGKVSIGRKDVTDIAAATTLFDQLDALSEVEKPTGFELAVNYAPISWEFYPTANLHRGAKLVSRQSSIDAFEAYLMPSSWTFPWTMDEGLVDMRTEEELLKHGFGDLRLKLTVSIEHLDELEVLQNFAFQDPFALNLLGAGEPAKLYYAERLTIDLMAGTIGIEGIDMQWILRQYFILGDELAIAENWSTATEANKIYGYLCDEVTWEFADGEPGKIMMDENL